MSLLAYYLTLPTTYSLTVELLHTFAAGSYYGMGADESQNILFIANSSGNKVERFNLATNTALTPFAVGTAPIGASIENGQLLVTRDASNVPVIVCDPSTGAQVRSFGSVQFSAGVRYNPADQRYYVSDYAGYLRAYDEEGTLVKTLSTASPHAVSLKGGAIYFGRRTDHYYSVYNPQTDVLTPTILPRPSELKAGRHEWTPQGLMLLGDPIDSSGKLRLFTADLSMQVAVASTGFQMTGVTRCNGQMYAMSLSGRLYKVTIT